jgi:hypothetical protein
LSKLDLCATTFTLTNDQQPTTADHGAHRHQPPLVLPDLQAKAAVMKAEAEAVTFGDRNTGGGGSGGNEDNGGDSNGGCTDTRTINNQLKTAVATATKTTMDGDSDNDDYDNDGDAGGGGSGGDGGRQWRWAL